MSLIYKIKSYFRKTQKELPHALVRGLLSRNGENGHKAFTARLEQHAPDLDAVVKQALRSGDYTEISAAYESFAAEIMSSDIVDVDFPAYRAGGIFRNSFPLVKMLHSLALFYTEDKGAEAFLHCLASADNTNHISFLAYARVLLSNRKYREAADAALSARRLVEYDYCCTRMVNDTQRALFTNGLPTDFPVPQVDNSKRFCEMPFTYLNYAPAAGGPLSMATTCCPSGDWLPMAFEIDPSWNNENLQAVRASILDGSYKYCDEVRCLPLRDGMLPLRDNITDPYLRGIIDTNKICMEKGPHTLLLGYDSGCNLCCPSCRSKPYMNDKNTTEILNDRMDKELTPILPGVKVIYMSCFGEALASEHSRRILTSLTPDKYPDLHINLMTNLSLLTPKEWEKLGPATACIKGLLMSIDGGTPATVEKLRKGLKWERMLEALTFARDLRRSEKVTFSAITFMLQKDNYTELKEILALASEYCIDSLRIPLLTGHGSYSTKEFNEINICDPQNPLYEEAMKAVEELKCVHAHLLQNKDEIIASGRFVPEVVWRLA